MFTKLFWPLVDFFALLQGKNYTSQNSQTFRLEQPPVSTAVQLQETSRGQRSHGQSFVSGRKSQDQQIQMKIWKRLQRKQYFCILVWKSLKEWLTWEVVAKIIEEGDKLSAVKKWALVKVISGSRNLQILHHLGSKDQEWVGTHF